MNRQHHLLLAAGLGAALLGSTTQASAGGFSNLDFGIRRMGMFAVTTRPDDGTAIFHNPAGMMLTKGTVFYHSQTWAMIDLGLRMYDSEGNLRPDHEISPDINMGILPFLAVTSDLGGKDHWRVGLGVYAPNAYGAALPDNEPTRYHATQALFIAARTTGSVAYEVSDRLTIAGSLSAIGIYLNAQRMMNPLVISDPDRRFDSVEDTRATDGQLDITGTDVTWGVDLGLLLRPTPTFRMGASFSQGAPVELEGNAVLTYADGRRESTTHKTTMAIPFNLRGGINWEFAPDFEVGADIYWWNYQVFQEQRTILAKPIQGQPGFVDQKNYGSSVNWCIGLLHHVTPDWELMLGYQEDYSPIPKRSYTLENPTTDLRGVSTAVRWQATPNLRVGLAAVRNWYELIDVQVSQSVPPSNVKGHGGNTEVGFDLTWAL